VLAGIAVRVFHTSAGDDDDESTRVRTEADDEGFGSCDVSTD